MFKFVQKDTEKPDYLVGRDWGALKKAWKEYRQAKDDVNEDKMIQFATKIRNLQKKLSIKQSEFPELSMF